MKITESYPKISVEDIEQVELACEVKLPREYREFILKHNGGGPEHHDYKLSGEYAGDFSHFYGIREYPASSDLRTMLEEYRELIPSGYFPIGESYGGDVLCVCLEQSELGSIYMWDHETANYDGEPWLENMSKLAPDLNDFLAMLYTEE